MPGENYGVWGCGWCRRTKGLAISNYQRPNSRAQEAWLREITKTREKFSDLMRMRCVSSRKSIHFSFDVCGHVMPSLHYIQARFWLFFPLLSFRRNCEDGLKQSEVWVCFRRETCPRKPMRLPNLPHDHTKKWGKSALQLSAFGDTYYNNFNNNFILVWIF